MKTIVLAGGRGRRMGALTDTKPKPLVEVNNKPILEHAISYALEAGIDDYLINVGYLGQQIKDYFGDGADLGVRISYFEAEGKGPESVILSARKYLNGSDAFCFCGDNILFPWQIKKIVSFNNLMAADATFTIETGEPETLKRVKLDSISGEYRIISASRDLKDYVLVYNAFMKHDFLDQLDEPLKNKQDMSFAYAMDELASKHLIMAADIGYFININQNCLIERK